jgi:hypothetical protein
VVSVGSVGLAATTCRTKDCQEPLHVDFRSDDWDRKLEGMLGLGAYRADVVTMSSHRLSSLISKATSSRYRSSRCSS